MSHAIPPKASLWPLLFRIDEGFSGQIRARGCPRCGGRLDRADYDRKPRGGPASGVEPRFFRRLSLCCSREGCRRRALPPSARFLGRRVYVGVIVTLVAALRQGPTPARMKKLVEVFDVDRRTVERWGRWWRETFAESAAWRESRSRMREPDEPAPRRLVLVFDAAKGADRQAEMMRWLAAHGLTTGTLGEGTPGGRDGTQKMPAVPS